MKPLETVLPYSTGITVERPEPVGDYKVPDGRHLAGIVGRVELAGAPGLVEEGAAQRPRPVVEVDGHRDLR